MAPFDLIEPPSLREAALLLDGDADGVRPFGGGTALMLMMKMGVLRPPRLVSLRGIEPRYFAIEAAPDGALRIGAMATLSALEKSPVAQAHAPVIARALRTLANVRVRNVATVGGHLAHADPHMDLPPALIALDATVRGIGARGEWAKPLEDLYAGYLETTLARGELIAEVLVPHHPARRAAYCKCTTRTADDWPALGIAVALDVEGGEIRGARVVVSAATDRPTRIAAVENLLRGTRGDDAVLRRAGEAGAAAAQLIGDQHGSAAYKAQLLKVHLPRALRAALQEAPRQAAGVR